MSKCIECGKVLGTGERGLLGLGFRCSQCETNQILRENAQNSKPKNTEPRPRKTEEEIHEDYERIHEELDSQSTWFWAVNFLILLGFSNPDFKQKYVYHWADFKWWQISLVILFALIICFVFAKNFRRLLIRKFPQNKKYAGTGSPFLNLGSIAILILNIYVVFEFNLISWIFGLIKNLWTWFIGTL